MTPAGVGFDALPSWCAYVKRASLKRKAAEISRSEGGVFTFLTINTTSQDQTKQLLDIITNVSLPFVQNVHYWHYCNYCHYLSSSSSRDVILPIHLFAPWAILWRKLCNQDVKFIRNLSMNVCITKISIGYFFHLRRSYVIVPFRKGWKPTTWLYWIDLIQAIKRFISKRRYAKKLYEKFQPQFFAKPWRIKRNLPSQDQIKEPYLKHFSCWIRKRPLSWHCFMLMLPFPDNTWPIIQYTVSSNYST